MIRNTGTGVKLIYVFPAKRKGVTVRLTDLINPELQDVLKFYVQQFGPPEILQDRRAAPRIWEAT